MANGPRRRAGFTLLEMMVVLSIIAILAGLAVANLRSNSLQARVYNTAQNVVMDLSKLRIIAVTTGIPTVMCLNGPTHVSFIPNVDQPNTLTEYTLRAQPTGIVSPGFDAGQMTLVYDGGNEWRTLRYVDYPTLGGNLVEMAAGLADAGNIPSAGSLTVAFDSLGRPSIYMSNSGCNDGSMSPVACTDAGFPIPFHLAAGANAPTYISAAVVNCDGTVRVQ